jgi:DNA polymerase-3 subunit alpha
VPAAGCPVMIRYYNEGAQCEVALGAAWRVNPDENLTLSLADWLTAQNVEIQYQ